MRYLITCAVVLCLGGYSFGDIWTVDDDGMADFSYIQDAIDAASDGDEILVAPGTYGESINFGGKAVIVASTSGPAFTTIDGAGLPANSWVVRMANGEGRDSVLRGFTVSNSPFSGIACDGASPSIINCVVIENGDDGVVVVNGSPLLSDCLIEGNCTNPNSGGNGLEFYNCTGLVDRCIIANHNLAGFGGGVRLDYSSVLITNTLIMNNASSGAGGISTYQSHPSLINCTLTGNYPAAIRFNGSTATLANCVVWGNGAVQTGGSVIDIAATYSCLQSEYAGPGNIVVDPLFAEPSDDNFQLSSGSPCIDSANVSDLPSGYDCDLNDMVRFGTSGLDMGAYEYGTPSRGISTGACCTNSQCVILSQDICEQVFGTYLGDSSSCAGSPCPVPCLGDVNGDGQVNVADLLTVIANWNNCP